MTDPLSECLSLASRRLSRVVAQTYDQALSPTGLKITQFSVLTAISKAQAHGLPMSGVAEAIDMDQSSLTRAIAPFIRDGLVILKEEKDRRRRSPALTKKGEALLSQATDAWNLAQSELEKAIGTDLMNEGREMMQKMRERIAKP